MALDRIAILDGFGPDDVLSWHRGRPVAGAPFCGAARRLAARLPPARYAVNLCEETPNFLLGSVAALLSGQTLLMPPSRLAQSLADIRLSHPDSYCLTDSEVAGTEATLCVSVDVASEVDASQSDWPPPVADAAHVAAVLFTSGSTRAPWPHAKTWGELVAGARTLMASFGRPPSGTGIIGTVAPQHMFGFETTVMLPLQSGAAVLETRPAYPADLAEALTVAARRNIGTLWLMTTPLQLRAFHRGLPALRGLNRIITATMPLARDLAQGVERDWEVRLEEIFGCTEGGILATRRPAETPMWTPAAGLEFSVDADGSARVQGAHLPRPLSLSDRIRMVESPAGATSGAFELVGRDEDVVKIAGKRASLSGLADQALAIAGVRDAVFFVPGPGSVRLAAILAAPERSLDDLRAELARRIDAAFLPRPLVLVETMARDSNGKLPRAALEKMLGAATTSRAQAPAPEDVVLERAWCVPADHPALPGHFPGWPVVPGVMLLDAVEAMLADHGYRLRECMQVKFIAPVAPVSPLTLRLEISGGQHVRFLIRSAGQTAVTGVLRCSRVEAST
jgi:hypothetical protein